MRLFGTDIQEVINTVNKKLGKTIIINSAVKGKVVVCSYERLNELQCYQFLLNVLDVYDYAVIGMPNNVLKVIVAKNISPILMAVDGRSFRLAFLPACGSL